MHKFRNDTMSRLLMSPKRAKKVSPYWAEVRGISLRYKSFGEMIPFRGKRNRTLFLNGQGRPMECQLLCFVRVVNTPMFPACRTVKTSGSSKQGFNANSRLHLFSETGYVSSHRDWPTKGSEGLETILHHDGFHYTNFQINMIQERRFSMACC